MKAIIKTVILAVFCLYVGQSECHAMPVMRVKDKLLIKEAISISNLYGESVWKGINKIPFAIVLVTDSIEFLVHHPDPSADFLFSEQDTILGTTVFYRKRQFGKHLFATFPAVGGLNCIVAGTPENTGMNPTSWIITLLHEHFHQYEYSYPGYFKSVEELGLSGGDQTGMWMLNYPFPYDSSHVIEQYKKYTQALSTLLKGMDGKMFSGLFKMYKTERKKMKQLLQPADYRYFSFQVWQEGLARYTEYKFLELLDQYSASAEVTALPGFVQFSEYKKQLYESEFKNLTNLSLNKDKRICFYSLGFAEGILLDKLNPKWHSLFLKRKFYIERYSRKFK
jgi:hypothetical protein